MRRRLAVNGMPSDDSSAGGGVTTGATFATSVGRHIDELCAGMPEVDSREVGLDSSSCAPMISAEVESGGKTRNRTGDTLIFSQLLYQLSYLAMRFAAREVRAKDARGVRQWEF